eukprot:4353936-Ditylum_brightwellii.AAC.1
MFDKVWNKHKLTIPCTLERTSKDYQPGGTATLVSGKWTGYVYASGKDILGRWSYITLKGKKNRKVTIILAYHVCDNNLNEAGPKTCWKQQWRQLHKCGYAAPDPWTLFFQNFNKFIEGQVERDKELIITIGANEVDIANSDIRTFHNRHEPTKVFAHKHPYVTPPHTYQCSNNKIDYLCVTLALIPTINAVGFLPFNVPFLIDHGSIFADFDEELLLLGHIINPIDRSTRNLVANNPKCRD